jgi:hypothetical protein
MPLFDFFGWWDPYLSAALYSGNTLNGRLYVDVKVRNALPPAARENHTYWTDKEMPLPAPVYSVDLANWAMEELNVPPYPARRVYRSLARTLARKGESLDGVVLIIEEPPNWRTGKRIETREELELDPK